MLFLLKKRKFSSLFILAKVQCRAKRNYIKILHFVKIGSYVVFKRNLVKVMVFNATFNNISLIS
jgi:hypothetical protein